MNTPLAVAAALVAVATVQALAQSMPTQPAPPASTGEVRFIDALRSSEVTASELNGTEVRGLDDSPLGDISDIVLDPAGAIRAVVLDVGGVFGIGAKKVAVPFDALRIVSIVPGPGGGANRTMEGGGGRQDWGTYHRVTLGVTSKQIKLAPAFSAARVNTLDQLSQTVAQ
jgi:sporulation protein YlmC with PRC-barrel domain